ncbi:zinc finger domain-containing protein [Streptomyces roseolilacinus]
MKPADWLKVTCPRCGAAPGAPCTGVRTLKGASVSPKVPHQERP